MVRGERERMNVTFVQKCPPCRIVRAPFVQQARNQLASAMPRRKVGQVRIDHLISVGELSLDHAAPFKGSALELLDDVSAVAPGVEVASILAQHLGRKTQLFLPYSAGHGWAQPGDSLLEDPEPVAPDPVAFRGLEEERDGECEL